MTDTILIADDETNITDVCSRYLQREGYRTITASNGKEALRLWEEERPSLLVLDLMMPELSGWEVCEVIRHREDVPILMLTARGEEADRLLGLTMGADDYMTKPFSPRELVLRVKSILRRTGSTYPSISKEANSSGRRLRFDGLELEEDTRKVWAAGQPVVLTAKEFELLWLLARHPGQVFSRSRLLELLWDSSYEGDMATVTVHIRRLREKIEPNPSEPRYVHTVWGIGYKLEAGGKPG